MMTIRVIIRLTNDQETNKKGLSSKEAEVDLMKEGKIKASSQAIATIRNGLRSQVLITKIRERVVPLLAMRKERLRSSEE